MSPRLEDPSAVILDPHEPQSIMSGPPDPLNVATSFDQENASTATSIPPSQMVPLLTTADILSQRRRRKGSSSLKRSASTPNVRGHQNGDAGMTLAEKRRNKLGYHRTSIACSMYPHILNVGDDD